VRRSMIAELMPDMSGRRGERLVASGLLGARVKPAARLMLNELRRGRRICRYRLRGSDVQLLVRHRSEDLATLSEIFGRGLYALPAEVRAGLERIDRRLRIADLGANTGLFSAFVLSELRRPLTITAYEPDPGHFAVLEKCAALNREADWQLHEAAAATSPGTLRFAAGLGPSSHVVADGDEGPVIEVRAEDALPDLVSADLIKMDIEGGEWDILADGRLAQTRALGIVLEYHPDARAATPLEIASQHLVRCGFAIREIHRHPDGHGMLWGLRDLAAT
jgi:FkbM family methyltransferase